MQRTPQENIEENVICRFYDDEEETTINLLTYCGAMLHKNKNIAYIEGGTGCCSLEIEFNAVE